MEQAGSRYNAFDAEPVYREAGNIIGAGRAGGKAKGLAFAASALAGSPLEGAVRFPDLTTVLSTEVFDDYISASGLGWLYDEEDWGKIEAAIEAAPLSEALERDLRALLGRFAEIGSPPLAVRSSSLLEDSVSLAFAGKYHTAFSPNIGDEDRRLADLVRCVKAVYASLFNPSARAYREKHRRAHRDESMAIVLQSVSGRRHGNMYYPELAGTIFSRVYRRPSVRIKKEDGLMRLAFGLGTRTVDRCAARTFYLTNPSLRPEGSVPAQIATYSQEFFDYIDLEKGSFETGYLADLEDMIRREHRNFGAYVEFYAAGELHSAMAMLDGPSRPLFSFPELHTRERALFSTAKQLMALMEERAGVPMDMEFTYESRPESEFRLVQMRPLTSFDEAGGITLPDVAPERVLFKGDRMISSGRVERATKLVYVDPHLYKEQWAPGEAARAVGEINKKLADEKYILAGPGRWGSRNPALGVPIVYAEICNSCCLVEISVPELSFSPELSFGTHFFLDMDSDGILYLPVFGGQKENVYAKELLDGMPYTQGSHPAVRVYDGEFSVWMDGETERGMVMIGGR